MKNLSIFAATVVVPNQTLHIPEETFLGLHKTKSLTNKQSPSSIDIISLTEGDTQCRRRPPVTAQGSQRHSLDKR